MAMRYVLSENPSCWEQLGDEHGPQRWPSDDAENEYYRHQEDRELLRGFVFYLAGKVEVTGAYRDEDDEFRTGVLPERILLGLVDEYC